MRQITFVVASMMLFGNEMLLTSLYMASIAVSLALVLLDPVLSKISVRPMYVALSLSCFIAGTLGLKFGVSKLFRVEDDILQELFKSWVIPCAVLGILLFVVCFFFTERNELFWRRGEREKPYAEVFYNVVQCLCYSVMALLIMRLKLLMTPHLCICCAVLANNKMFSTGGIRLNKHTHAVLIVAIISAMAFAGKPKVEKLLQLEGDYIYPEDKPFFEWILKETKESDVFAGSMVITPMIKLSTLRPILNHPHYEDVGMRETTKQVYSLLSRKPIKEVHSSLKRMGANYVVFLLSDCSTEPDFL
ncbi:hypothetical protein ANCDUO_09163 [Ancylostoma duodenale]|uniref:Uncharacterized protein n=1 Tax=Ancylostoma duodenale TaxID=51022 RepID=A0A0C2GNC2_9BILA|nr:hypothetical protein ANCDUO_09163 [Ancylostoma duodenale]